MSTQRCIVNGTEVEVEVEDDVRLPWVLRDLLGVTGPKYGCGLWICQSCTSHINGKVFNPCAVPVGDLKPQDHITTIEGLADTFDGAELHPVQQVWIDEDVAQCGFCQPGQIMAAVGLIEESHGKGREITDEDLDALRSVCRCGTYPRVRTAIRKAAEVMGALPPTLRNRRREVPGGPGAGAAATPGARKGRVSGRPTPGRRSRPDRVPPSPSASTAARWPAGPMQRCWDPPSPPPVPRWPCGLRRRAEALAPDTDPDGDGEGDGST